MVDKRKHEMEDSMHTEESENEPEEIELEEIEEQQSDKLKALREKLKACEAEKMRHLEDLQRAKADFLNSKRRIEEQSARDRERTTESILLDIIPLVDSFDMAMADEEAWKKCDEKWRSGMEAIYAQLTGLLRSYGVEEIATVGIPFDPELHEAVSNQKVESGKAGNIIAALQKGFRRGASVIRPARVVVGIED